MRNRFSRLLKLISVVGVLAVSAVLVFSLAASAELTDGAGTTPDGQPVISHRFIVELQSAPLAIHYKEMVGAQSTDGKLDPNSTVAQSYVEQLQAEQALFVSRMQAALPNAKVSTYIDENGISNQETYQVVLNAVVVDAGFAAGTAELKVLSGLPGVKTVYRDYQYYPQLYTSTHLINAPMAWGMLGGQAMAGKGVKVASMDGGVHKDAPMFNGTGWSYPTNFPTNGLGLTSNNNGKIIASRAYFRWWDPPAPGDDNPWPGQNGTSHGVHTASTAAGNVITNGEYVGSALPPFSGVAPGAWLMSYRVFYASILGDGSFHTAEGVAALEDLVKDGADVVNNSWGGGPGGVGAPFDAIDQALVNAANAGVFVSMSNGNAGPNLGTGDHPSPEYINVAASTTDGTYASGRVGQHGPAPISDTVKYNVAFASFGGSVPLGQQLVQDYIAAAVIEPANVTGCAAFGANAFQGKTALISRGGCEFGVKALNAQNAGASFVVIYNNAGNGLINMGGGVVGGQVTIPAIFVGNTGGLSLVNFAVGHPNDAQMVVDTQGFQAGSTPDLIASFSSRGPSMRNSLKPDIAAPGVNIMAQGYTIGATGEARHLGFGQASGTSMASPHVAGSAALLRQKYPTWSNASIKSALMSTSKYMDIYNFNGTPAQPTDMGAGRLDVGAAMNPGVILAPPAADFGLVYTGTAKMGREIAVTNVTAQAETYNISTLYTGNGFAPTQTTTLLGVTVVPSSLSLNPGETKKVTIGFDPALGMGMGINQGYVVLQGSNHKAHLPFFARVAAGVKSADVLLIDNDGSSSLGTPNYAMYYTATLDSLGYTWDYLNADATAGSATQFVPDLTALKAYTAVIVFTGNNFRPDGTFTVPTPLTGGDMERLNEYAQAGGKVIVMGQDASGVMGGDGTNPPFFYGSTLGGIFLQDSVSGGALPSLPVEGRKGAGSKFFNLYLDLTSVNHAVGSTVLSGLNESTPVTDSVAMGTADFTYDNFTGQLTYSVEISVTDILTLTAAHIHSGTVGSAGGVIFPTFPFTQNQVVTETIAWGGSVTMSPAQNAQREAGGMYFNVHSTVHGGGEVRGQVPSVAVVGDGAGNQQYIDELATNGWSQLGDPSADPSEIAQYQALMRYPGPSLVDDGTVAMGHRDQPTLERPGVSTLARTVYASFGLEGVNNGVGVTTREELVQTFWNYLMDEPTATINHTMDIQNSQLALFQVNFASNVSDASMYRTRWDFGDGATYSDWVFGIASHHYIECGTYTVRAEVMDNYGNHALASRQVNITACEVPVKGTVTAGAGGQLRSDDGDINLNFPAGAVAGDVVISLAKQYDPSQMMLGLSYAGKAFSITAKDTNGNDVTTFSQPFTLMLKYKDSDWQNAGITKEANLNVYFYKDGAWTPIFPCVGCSHDMDKNEFTLKLDHLTEFALAGPKVRLILPNIFR